MPISGASAVQVALLTRRITQLTEHFRTHPKDHASRHGLQRMVGQRRRLMGYLSRKDADTYRNLLKEAEPEEIASRGTALRRKPRRKEVTWHIP